MGVFATLKERFRYWFRERCYGRASEVTDKTDFLWAFSQAWKEVMITSKYIMNGWETTDLRPINKAKVLNNRYVRAGGAKGNTSARRSIRTLERPDFLAQMAALGVKTPKSSRELARLEKSLVEVNPTYGNPTVRLLFRKFAKALDDKTTKLTAAEVRNSQLTAAVEKAKHKVRRKVQPEPNEDFVKMISVRKVKVGLKAPAKGRSTVTRQNQQQNEPPEGEEDSEVEVDCIIVRST
ncbi:hypothetical protein DL763_008316 [Monosporascus cannonballus]|nr:hypothetical protein DL763_008316 [Monosporascus cannonballus]